MYVDIEGALKKGSKISQPTGKFIANGVSRCDLGTVFKLSRGVAVEVTFMEHKMPPLSDLFHGQLYPQNLPSLAVGYALDVIGTEKLWILDMCAAPGGKCLHVASLSRNKNNIVALDSSRNRLESLRANIIAHSANSICAYHYDSSRLDISSLPGVRLDSDFDGFDRIILDPPCSGFGKRPCLVPRYPEADFACYQKKLLRKAWSLLKPGGVLCYSTCSILPQENEEVVLDLLEFSANAYLEEPCFLKLFSPGLNMSASHPLHRCVRFVPPFSDTIGFFIAKIRKSPLSN